MVKIDKVKNYKYVGRTVFEATYLGWVQCVELCARMSVCKSMNYLAVGKICQINSDAPSVSVISWWPVLLVEETGVPGANHRPVASH
jgi:hypothetical protein